MLDISAIDYIRCYALLIMVVKQIDNKTRITLVRFYFLALEGVYKLQRKTWYGWSTVSWIYPSCLAIKTLDFAETYLISSENKEKSKNKSEYNIGKEIINN